MYFDYQSTTPLDNRAAEVMFPYYFQYFGNPHSTLHSYGWQASSAVENARREIAGLISADEDEILFTSGATEANNLAILGLAKRRDRNRNKILISSIEHKSILAPTRQLINDGYNVDLIPVNSSGNIDLSWLADNIDEKTLLVSVIAVNNEIGSIQDLQSIAQICRPYGSFFHVDAAQAFPSISVNVYSQEIDLLSLSAHKIYGPKGIGALYIRRELQGAIKPLFFGGEQEAGLRPGTLPVPLCVGFGKAASLVLKEGQEEQKRLIELRDCFFEGIKRKIEAAELIGPQLNNRHAGNLNIYFPGVRAEELLASLQPKLAASTGSACTSGIVESSHVLAAIGISEDKAKSCIRISVGRPTTAQEITNAISLISETYHAFVK